MKKFFLVTLLVAFISGWLMVSIGNAEEPITLTLGIIAGPEADAHKRLAPLFEEYTGGKIRLRVEEIARTGYIAKMLSVLTSHTGTYDLLIDLPYRHSLYVEAGFLEPLNSYMENPELFNAAEYNLEDYPAAVLNNFTTDGKLYAIPQECSSYLLFYRTDLLKEYGIAEPPKEGWHWEKEYFEAAEKLTLDKDGDGNTDIYGVVHAGKRSGNLGYEGWNTMLSYGGGVLTDDYQIIVNSPESVKGAEVYLTPFKKGWASPGIVGYEYPEVLTALQEGRAAMAIGWNAMAPTLLDPEKSPITAGNLGFSVIPYGDAGPEALRMIPSVWALSICADSKHKEEAFQYLTWFTSKEIARDYVVHGGGSSGRASLLSDPEILKDNPQYLALLDSMKLYPTFPPIKEGEYLVEEFLPTYFSEALTGDQPVKYYLDQCAKDLKDFLLDKGYPVKE